MDDSWHYAVGSEQRGPISSTQLRQLLETGQLTLETLVWQNGMAEWTPAGMVPQIHGYTTAAPINPTQFPTAGTTTATPLNYYSAALPFAGFWLRVCAYAIDWLVIGLPFVIINKAVISTPPLAAGAPGPRMIAPAFSGIWCGIFTFQLVIAWLYYALMESSARQATLGKLALGLKVTDLQGMRISFGRATARHFAKIISTLTLGIGYLMVVFTQRKQALHDVLAETLVVKR